MRQYLVYIPGVAQPHAVLADDEDGAIADALYSLGLRDVPAGTTVTAELDGDTACSFAT